jgi:predicted ATPase
MAAINCHHARWHVNPYRLLLFLFADFIDFQNGIFYLRPDASNLAAFLLKLNEESPDSYDAIRRTIRLVAPFFKDFLLRPRPKTEKIQLEWIEHSSDFPFRADHLSDGTLRFICLATLLLQPKLPENDSH